MSIKGTTPRRMQAGRRLAVATAGVVVAGFLFGWQVGKPRRQPRSVESSLSPTEGSTADSRRTSAPKLLEQAAEEVKHERLRVIAPAPPETDEDSVPEAVRAVQDAVRSMTAVQGLYTQNTERARLMDDILASKDRVDVLLAALANEQNAREVFGELQAQARYLAIRTFERGARNGQHGPLQDAWSHVLKDVHGQASVAEGRLADVRDLAFALTETTDASEPDTLKGTLQRELALPPTLPEDVRREIDYAVFSSLSRRLGRPLAATITGAVLERA